MSYHLKDLSQHSGGEAAKRPKSFHADSRVDVDAFRVKPADYNNSGFDRGHMTPAADYSLSQQAMDSTFTMANVCPQSPQLNKGQDN